MKIVGTITEYGENDVSMEYLELPQEVSDAIMRMIEPFCEASMRGTIKQVARDMEDTWVPEPREIEF